MKHSLFPWILEGHEFLWLPEKIGQPIKENPSQHLWKKYEQANGGDLLMRSAYDIHIGAIWGLPGKIPVFLEA